MEWISRGELQSLGVKIGHTNKLRLRELSRWEILRSAEFDPMRYMESLEPVGFTDVKVCDA